jgi:hypothetical protein
MTNLNAVITTTTPTTLASVITQNRLWKKVSKHANVAFLAKASQRNQYMLAQFRMAWRVFRALLLG